MPRVILLPKPSIPEGWGEEKGSSFKLSKERLISNLSPDEQLSAEGIPSPWARVLLMNWRLEDQNRPSGIAAISEMRSLILAQFLGYLAGESVRLADNGSEGFGRLCKALGFANWYSSLVLWRAHNLNGFTERQVVAGTTEDCLFFSAGDVTAEILDQALRDSVRPELYGAVSAASITSPDFAATLAEYLKHLANPLPKWWQAALEKWREELSRLNGQVIPTAVRSFSLDHSVIMRAQIWTDQAPWDCPDCVRDRGSWVNAAGDDKYLTQTVTAQNAIIACQKHQKQICTNSGRGAPVGFSDFGCHRGRRYDESQQRWVDHLYVWNEPKAWPRGATATRVVVPTNDAPYIEHRFNNQVVQVKGQLIKLSDVLLNEVAWAARKDTADRRPVDVPIRGEFAALLQDCRTDAVAPRWVIRLKGYPGEISRNFPQPASAAWSKSAILVWPPEEISGWKIDFIAASAPNADRLAFRTIEADATEDAVRPSSIRRLLGVYRTSGTTIRYVAGGV